MSVATIEGLNYPYSGIMKDVARQMGIKSMKIFNFFFGA